LAKEEVLAQKDQASTSLPTEWLRLQESLQTKQGASQIKSPPAENCAISWEKKPEPQFPMQANAGA
jgi:hypothetical protein